MEKKKLTLKKETIAVLTGSQNSSHKGGNLYHTYGNECDQAATRSCKDCDTYYDCITLGCDNSRGCVTLEGSCAVICNHG